MTCLACERPIPPTRGPDWCSKPCRRALRRLGASLLPDDDHQAQLDAALAHRRTMAGLGHSMSPTFAPTCYRRPRSLGTVDERGP